MGHAEMLLAVAGLSEEEIQKRKGKLASGDWSDFPARERLAFHLGHKLAKEPWAVTDGDVKALADTFGRHRAVDLIWYGSWCNYMTRVADAFQLPLERENVFQQREKEKDESKESRKPKGS
jgi:hypothetical protein